MCMTHAKKVLIVDDDHSLRSLLRENLEAEGLHVLDTENGESGLKTAFRERPDIILLDIDMPEMDGIVMLNILRQNPRGAKIPVVMLTNIDDISRVADALESESYDYLLKNDTEIRRVIEVVKDRLGLS